MIIRYLAALFLVFALAATTLSLVGDTLVAEPTAQQVQQVPVVKPVRVYMIHDPEKDRWYRENLLGLSGWGAQNQGQVWTVQADAKAVLSTMLGARAKRYKIEAFLLISVKNNK